MRPACALCLLFLAAASASAPELVFLGYLGGAGTDDCDGIALDSAGDIYLGCHSDSPGFPGLAARPASPSRNDMDAVIVKIDVRSGAVAWAARTGGSAWDAAGDLALAPDGSVFVLGSTRSTDFPTTPDAVQRRFAGPDRDVFLLKLDPRGRIVYSTLLGGSANDEASALALSGSGDVYIGGVTFSADFPAPPGSSTLGPGGRQDAFIARIRPGDPHSLRTLRIGGSGQDRVSAMVLGPSGSLFAAGYTASPDFPTKNAAQPKFGGAVDAFLAELRPDGWSLVSSTFLGGAKMDGAYSLALDAGGNPIVSGVTESDDFPATAAAFQPRRRGPVDAFVTKFAAGRVAWSTYFGGSRANSDQFEGGSVAVDVTGRIWFTGMTASGDLPTRGAFQPAFGGGDFDGFLAALSPDGARLCFASYLGGPAHDILEGLAVGGGRVWASGLTASPGLAQKGSRIQRGYGGGPYDSIVLGLPLPNDPCR